VVDVVMIPRVDVREQQGQYSERSLGPIAKVAQFVDFSLSEGWRFTPHRHPLVDFLDRKALRPMVADDVAQFAQQCIQP
jgi:hypothetical protein